MDLQNNNKVRITGEIISNFIFSHRYIGESFYLTNVSVGRLSGKEDIIPIMVSERLLDVSQNYVGCTIEALGQFRSYNRQEGERNRLALSVFVQEISFMEEFADRKKNNQVFLDGYICKAPTYRETTLGREIADLMLAVNRPYGKTDYIPCVAWGRNARYASGFEIGTNIIVSGRIQSREYIKKISDSEYEKRIAYEVSVNKLEVPNEAT